MRYLYFQPLLASQKALLASNKSFEASTQTTSLENELPQHPKVNLNKRLEPKTKSYHIMKGHSTTLGDLSRSRQIDLLKTDY